MNIPNANRYYDKTGARHAHGHRQPIHQSLPASGNDQGALKVGMGVIGVVGLGVLLVTHPILTLLSVVGASAVAYAVSDA